MGTYYKKKEMFIREIVRKIDKIDFILERIGKNKVKLTRMREKLTNLIRLNHKQKDIEDIKNELYGG